MTLADKQQDDSRGQPSAGVFGKHRAALLSAILFAQLIVLTVLSLFIIEIDCAATGSYGLCRGLRSAFGRSLALATGVAFLLLARPAIFAEFPHRTTSVTRVNRLPALASVAGFGILIVPAVFLAQSAGPDQFARAVPLWIIGGLIAVPSALRWIAPFADWAWLLRNLGWLGGAVLIFVTFMPEMGEAMQPVWSIEALTFLTFALVYVRLRALGTGAFADPETNILGVEDFAIHIAAHSYGVEGFVLVGGFVSLYTALFHKAIRHGRFWLIVVPLALLASWVLNIVRIAMLVLLGANVSPQLAVDGFHSYAGWFFFTLLALEILAVVHRSSALHRTEARAPATPLSQDIIAAQILPFVAFILGPDRIGLFAPAALGYPLRVAIMLAVVMPFWRLIRALPCRMEPVALGLGAGKGLVWVALQGAHRTVTQRSARCWQACRWRGAVFWLVLRVLGATNLVPLIEELFFRSYILARLNEPAWPRRGLAIMVSTATFAPLHASDLEATLAGLVFAFVYLRKGRVTDAVQAHMAANLVVAVIALVRGDLGLI